MPRTGPFEIRAAEYDRWFADHRSVYLAEIEAVRALLPPFRRALEVGAGTGRFAAPLGITSGVEPSAAMRRIARSRGIRALGAVAEALPFRDGVFDLMLLVTVVCFVEEIGRVFTEARRVLAAGGHILVAFLDRETELGRRYEARRAQSRFYREARFRSSAEVLAALAGAGFGELASVQAVFGPAGGGEGGAPRIEPGHGSGLFAVARGRKTQP